MTATALPIPAHHQAAVAAGCECWRCPLMGNNLGGPVMPTLPYGYKFLVVAEAPGVNEVEHGMPLIGASGKEVRRALAQGGMDSEQVGYSNAILCRPPGTDLKKFLTQSRKRGEANPIEACNPRLKNEIAHAQFVLLLGSASVTAAGVAKASVMKVRGTPLHLPSNVPAIATTHPAFVMRDEGARYRPVFAADVTKAVRISRTGSTWQDPWYFVPRSAAEVANFLAVDRPRVSTDVETDGVDPWTCGLRRVGIGDSKEVMIFAPLSVKGHALLDSENALAQARVIGDFYRRAPRIDVHNGIAFDSIILHRYGMPLVDEKVFDSLVGHQIGYTSELPHRLDFLGSMYTDAPYWKEDVKHSSVKDDNVLDRYLSFDIAVTHLGAGYVEQNLISANQAHVYSIDAELYRVGRSMAALGIYIDPQKRFAFAQEYQEKSDRLREEFVGVAGRDINPASYPQVRKLIYEDLGLPILDEHITDSDEPSTDEGTLLDLLAMGLDKRAEKVIHALLGFREAEKILGTNTGHVENGMLVGGPPVHLDGRLRTSWRPGKVTGRWGSSDPVNLTNIPKKLRAMFTPAPGNVFVAADMSAVELRAIAILAGDEPLIQAFCAFDAKTGPDVHIANACGVFGCQPGDVNDEIRNFIKRFVYALSYGAEPPKIYQTLSLLRTDDLRPMFPQITLQMVEKTYTKYWELHPAIPAWKKKNIYLWRARRYLETDFHKRKRYFIGGESPTEFANFPIQGICADMQNDAIRGLVRAYPFNFERHRGLVLNVHDQLVVECGVEEVEGVKKIVENVMQRRIGEMLFPAQAKSGADWKVVS